MKTKRHEAILDIIGNNDVETQEELIVKLSEMGFPATQATVSRDIRQLNLVKTTDKNGRYKYVAPAEKHDEGKHVYNAAFSPSIKSIEVAMNIVVIKTYPGLAGAVAANLDSVSNLGIVGCVAGDDTILAVTKSIESASFCAEKIKKQIKGE